MLDALASLHWQFIVEVGLGVGLGMLLYRGVEYVALRRVGVMLVVRRPESGVA
jgi:hypothetical protein